MLGLTDVFRAQSKFGISSSVSNNEKVTYAVYLSGCRRMLTDKTPKDWYSWDRRRQNDYTDNLIISYVRSNIKDVEGFLDDNGDIKSDDLIDRLRTDIIDFGILRNALEDDDVQEIQINDYKTIWVVKGGKSELYVDSTGKPYQFISDDELHSTIDRMIYNPNGNIPRMTYTAPLLNTRTAQKGYRLSAVNSSAITRDSKVGFDFPVTSVTIRKYAPSRLTFSDFENFNSIAPEMSVFLKLCGRADIKLICIGPTSSGKTTLLNAIVWEIPRDDRIILIQNPTEIMLYERSEETGANMRNALHWEAVDVDTKLVDDPSSPTMSNMIAHALRNTPDIIIPGEVRSAPEFLQVNRCLKTGHRVLSTLHAYDGGDAISRMSTELATLGGNAKDYASSIASSLDIAVTQRKLADGSRKVMSIEEYTGKVLEDGSGETRVLFRYKLTGEVDKDENGRVKKIHGYFEQVNPISEELVQKFFTAGISRDELKNFVTAPEVLDGRSNLKSQIKKESSKIPSFL